MGSAFVDAESAKLDRIPYPRPWFAKRSALLFLFLWQRSDLNFPNGAIGFFPGTVVEISFVTPLRLLCGLTIGTSPQEKSSISCHRTVIIRVLRARTVCGRCSVFS